MVSVSSLLSIAKCSIFPTDLLVILQCHLSTMDNIYIWPARQATLKCTEQKGSIQVRARLVDYLFPMSKVLKIRVGRSGKKKKKEKKRQKYL